MCLFFHLFCLSLFSCGGLFVFLIVCLAYPFYQLLSVCVCLSVCRSILLFFYISPFTWLSVCFLHWPSCYPFIYLHVCIYISAYFSYSSFCTFHLSFIRLCLSCNCVLPMSYGKRIPAAVTSCCMTREAGSGIPVTPLIDFNGPLHCFVSPSIVSGGFGCLVGIVI